MRRPGLNLLLGMTRTWADLRKPGHNPEYESAIAINRRCRSALDVPPMES